MPDNIYSPILFRPYSQIIIQRSTPGRAPYMDLETPWFVIDGPYADLSVAGERTMVVECVDALGLILGGANVAYQQYSEQAYKQGYATNIAKAIVRENLGSLATDTARDISGYMDIEADNDNGAWLSAMSFERMQVLDALQKIADASAQATAPVWMGFDIVNISGLFSDRLRFKTYTGQRGLDHRRTGAGKPLVLSATGGSLSAMRAGNSFRDAASFVYAGGESVGELKPVATASDTYLMGLGPFARRERYIDTQAPDAAALQAEANKGLRQFRPLRFMQAETVEVVGALRGIDWDYGDYVTAEAQNGESYDVRVNKIGVKLSAGRDGGLIEKSTVSLKGESYAFR